MNSKKKITVKESSSILQPGEQTSITYKDLGLPKRFLEIKKVNQCHPAKNNKDHDFTRSTKEVLIAKHDKEDHPTCQDLGLLHRRIY